MLLQINGKQENLLHAIETFARERGMELVPRAHPLEPGWIGFCIREGKHIAQIVIFPLDEQQQMAGLWIFSVGGFWTRLFSMRWTKSVFDGIGAKHSPRLA